MAWKTGLAKKPVLCGVALSHTLTAKALVPPTPRKRDRYTHGHPAVLLWFLSGELDRGARIQSAHGALVHTVHSGLVVGLDQRKIRPTSTTMFDSR